jgi:DNA-binding beta-propeller fold protein YncE
MLARAIGLAVVIALPAAGWAQAPGPPLALDTKIALGAVTGRIDHLAVDLKRRQLFVAELGNDSLGVVNIAARKMRSTMPGLKEPQGIGYEPSADIVYVANAGDGSVRLLWAEDLTSKGRIELGDDADNVRIDAARHRVLIGYGKGALALIDPKSRAKIADIPLKAHPEGFQIDEGAARAFVADVDTCGDADDLFVDAKRRRVYVSCGAGALDVFEEGAGAYQRIARIPTATGARTSLFVPDLDRLFVAVRASSGDPAAIWVFRPAP